ncbi:MAG: hypothetical protein FWE57_04820 [Chitinispirillia bacterium]|nr:hypothetical protein [Chitinispirillia bacterium]
MTGIKNRFSTKQSWLVCLVIAALFLRCDKIPEYCTDGEAFDPKTQFCFDGRPYKKCEGEEFDPTSARCDKGFLEIKCLNNFFNPAAEFCHNNAVHPKCGGSEYDPDIQECKNGIDIYTKCEGSDPVPIGIPCGGYTLTVMAGPAIGGSVTPVSPQTGIIREAVSITAVPNSEDGYTFVNWTITNGQVQIANVNNAVTTVALSSNATITANFRRPTDIPSDGQSLAAQLLTLHTSAQSGGEYTIELTGNENIGAQPLSFTDRSDITIRLTGSGGERTISLTDNGALFTIGTGVTLILDNRVTLRGRSSNNAPVVRVNSRGTLVMKAGSRISGNTTSASGGGVVVNTDGSFTMEGGEISGNTSSGWSAGGGGVYVAAGGYLLMENGRITGNSSSSGGGIYMAGGSVIMRSGEIINNTASTGGGVELGGGSFTMDGGIISNNTANTTSTSSGGGGVYVGNAIFTMSDGEISGNTARSGGGVFAANNAQFTKAGGIIYGYTLGDSKRNTATAGISGNDRGHAVFVNSNPSKRRESTAGVELGLDSGVSGAAGGWE